MAKSDKLRVTLMYAICALPWVFSFVFLGQLDHTMITASVPDETKSLFFACVAFFATVTIINRRLLFQNGKARHYLAGFWLVTAITIALKCQFYFSELYERHIFADSVQYNRTVKIDDVKREETRSGTNYYALLNPNRVESLKPRVKINQTLYAEAASFVNSRAIKGDVDHSDGCLIRVTIERAGSAERIVWKGGYINPSSVVTCS